MAKFTSMTPALLKNLAMCVVHKSLYKLDHPVAPKVSVFASINNHNALNGNSL